MSERPLWRRGVWDEAGVLRSGWVVLLFVGALALTGVGVHFLGKALGFPKGVEPMNPWMLASATSRAVQVLLSTWAVCRLIRQPMGEAFFGGDRALRRLGVGALWGAGAILLTTFIPLALGKETLRLSSEGPGRLVLMGCLVLAVMVPAAAAEEFLLRGLVLQQLRRGTGELLAVLLTSVTFGLLHLFNPNASWVAAVNISLVGALFALSVFVTGSLWFAVGAHVSWNWVQGFLLGQPVSGWSLPVALVHRTVPLEDVVWTGGAFGPEASAVTAVVLGAGTAVLLFVRIGQRQRAATGQNAVPVKVVET
jgi:uncharacterized protein